jgi:8-oxo-(d)GTP phosphatase
MRAVDGAFVPDDEVDEIRWLPRRDAADVLTWPRDLDVLEALG